MDGIIFAQVASLTPTGIHLEDGLLLPAACIFLDGTVFLWDPPASVTAWAREHLRVFEAVVPRPGGCLSAFPAFLLCSVLFYLHFKLPWTWIGVARLVRFFCDWRGLFFLTFLAFVPLPLFFQVTND
jgi:hypothetical protein